MVPKKIKLLFCIPCAIIFFYSSYLSIKYNVIPDIIPIHGYKEKADIYGDKIHLFLTVIINIVILIFIWFLIRNPTKINLPIDNDEKKKYSENIQLFLVYLAIFVTIIFSFLFNDVFTNI